jgi:hypothetical protein
VLAGFAFGPVSRRTRAGEPRYTPWGSGVTGAWPPGKEMDTGSRPSRSNPRQGVAEGGFDAADISGGDLHDDGPCRNACGLGRAVCGCIRGGPSGGNRGVVQPRDGGLYLVALAGRSADNFGGVGTWAGVAKGKCRMFGGRRSRMLTCHASGRVVEISAEDFEMDPLLNSASVRVYSWSWRVCSVSWLLRCLSSSLSWVSQLRR